MSRAISQSRVPFLVTLTLPAKSKTMNVVKLLMHREMSCGEAQKDKQGVIQKRLTYILSD